MQFWPTIHAMQVNDGSDGSSASVGTDAQNFYTSMR